MGRDSNQAADRDCSSVNRNGAGIVGRRDRELCQSGADRGVRSHALQHRQSGCRGRRGKRNGSAGSMDGGVLVSPKEEELVFNDRPADRAAESIVIVSRLAWYGSLRNSLLGQVVEGVEITVLHIPFA